VTATAGSPRSRAPRTARFALLAAVLLAAAVPIAAGYRLLAVAGASMTPTIRPGDLVLVKPVYPTQLRAGQVVTFPDPARPGAVVTHRVVATHKLPTGRVVVVTRGDANTATETWPAPASGRLALTVLRLPQAGVWLTPLGACLWAALVGLCGCALAVLTVWGIWGGPANAAARRWLALAVAVGVLAPGSTALSQATFAAATSNPDNSFSAAASFCSNPGTQTIDPDRDSYVDQAFPDANNGTKASLSVHSVTTQNRRTLVHFALPAKPSGCSVTSATLTFTVITSTSGRTLEAYQANAAWTETGSPGTTSRARPAPPQRPHRVLVPCSST
jgi:signal peptidase I